MAALFFFVADCYGVAECDEQMTATTRTQSKTFGVSMSNDEADLVDQRVADLAASLSVPMNRSSYFAMLARHDRKHRLIERIITQLRPPGRRAA